MLDFVADTCDALLSVPLVATCSLVAAVLQFTEAVSQPDAGLSSSKSCGLSTHAISLGELLVSICRAPGFSVVAATCPQESVSTAAGYVGSTGAQLSNDAAVRYKAMEVHRGLSAQVGPALQNLAETSTRQRQEQLNSYTLSSMLGSTDGVAGESIEHLLNPRDSAVARTIFSAALARSYNGLLQEVMMLLQNCDQQRVEALCIFDGRFDLLARLTVSSEKLPSAECCSVEVPDWCGAELIRASARQAGQEDKDNLTIWCWTYGPRGSVALLGPHVGPLRVGAQLRAPGSEAPAQSSVCADVLGVVQLPLRWACYDGVSWAVAEASRALASAFGESFQWPVGIRTGDEVAWGREVAGPAGKVSDVSGGHGVSVARAIAPVATSAAPAVPPDFAPPALPVLPLPLQGEGKAATIEAAESSARDYCKRLLVRVSEKHLGRL